MKALKEAFAAGIDIHTATAMQVFGLPREEVTPNVRRHAKAINFGVIYGISQYGLAKQIGISNDEAKKYIDAYFAKMPEIKRYMEQTVEFARKNGYAVAIGHPKSQTYEALKTWLPTLPGKNIKLVHMSEVVKVLN